MLFALMVLAGCKDLSLGGSSKPEDCKLCLETCRKKPEEIFGVGGSSYNRACLKEKCSALCMVSEDTCRDYMFAYQGPVAPQFAIELCQKMVPYFGNA